MGESLTGNKLWPKLCQAHVLFRKFRFSEVKICTCLLHKLNFFDQLIDQSKINRSEVILKGLWHYAALEDEFKKVLIARQ